MVVEAGGQEALEQLEGHDGCQAPDGVRRPKINRHAVPRMTLKSGMKKLPTGRTGTSNNFVRSGSEVLDPDPELFQAKHNLFSLNNCPDPDPLKNTLLNWIRISKYRYSCWRVIQL